MESGRQPYFSLWDPQCAAGPVHLHCSTLSRLLQYLLTWRGEEEEQEEQEVEEEVEEEEEQEAVKEEE